MIFHKLVPKLILECFGIQKQGAYVCVKYLKLLKLNLLIVPSRL